MSLGESEKLAALLAGSGLKDAALVDLLGVSQSTISRLRYGKIQKVSKYLKALEGRGLSRESSDFNSLMDELSQLAQSHHPLRHILENLHRLMQKGNSTLG